ncbi:MAG: hypothetical protein OXO50_07000 [Caldilineaceae bacterium]|nr:hypothetical protein [Caldilineaceae bacterium]
MVEEAWLAGDALLRIRQQLPHEAWLPSRKERSIAYTIANRFIRLRRQYPQINQLGDFDTVSAASTRGRSAIDGVGGENWKSERGRLALSDSALQHTLSQREVPSLLTCWDKLTLMRPDNRCGYV